jgi:hypothetical protein
MNSSSADAAADSSGGSEPPTGLAIRPSDPIPKSLGPASWPGAEGRATGLPVGSGPNGRGIIHSASDNGVPSLKTGGARPRAAPVAGRQVCHRFSCVAAINLR